MVRKTTDIMRTVTNVIRFTLRYFVWSHIKIHRQVVVYSCYGCSVKYLDQTGLQYKVRMIRKYSCCYKWILLGLREFGFTL